MGGPGSSVGIATGYGLDGPGIESNRTSLVGNYLQILGTWHCECKYNWDTLSVEWIKQAPVIAICEDSVA
jgi:hypothetical protein